MSALIWGRYSEGASTRAQLLGHKWWRGQGGGSGRKTYLVFYWRSPEGLWYVSWSDGLQIFKKKSCIGNEHDHLNFFLAYAEIQKNNQNEVNCNIFLAAQKSNIYIRYHLEVTFSNCVKFYDLSIWFKRKILYNIPIQYYKTPKAYLVEMRLAMNYLLNINRNLLNDENC